MLNNPISAGVNIFVPGIMLIQSELTIASLLFYNQKDTIISLAYQVIIKWYQDNKLKMPAKLACRWNFEFGTRSVVRYKNMGNTETLHLDKNSREIVGYGDPMFPLEIWTGNFNGKAGTGFPPHWHNEFEYGVILEGHMIYVFPEYAIELGPGDCIFVNANRMHYTKKQSDETVSMYTLAFPPSLICSDNQSVIYQKYILPETEPDFPALQIKEDSDAGRQIHQLLQKIYDNRDMAYGFELYMLSRVFRLWLETLFYLQSTDLSHYLSTVAANKKESAAIKSALSYIQAHYDEKLTVEDIASAAYISRNTCFRYFQSYFGKSPLEVLNEHRLTVAASLLSGDKPITEIAFSCGFGSSSYFARTFKAKFGMTPQKYRRKR